MAPPSAREDCERCPLSPGNAYRIVGAGVDRSREELQVDVFQQPGGTSFIGPAGNREGPGTFVSPPASEDFGTATEVSKMSDGCIGTSAGVLTMNRSQEKRGAEAEQQVN